MISDDLQDKYDDAIVGIKSTALKFKESTPYWLAGFSLMTVSGLTAAGIAAEASWPYFTAVGLTSLHLLHQVMILAEICP